MGERKSQPKGLKDYAIALEIGVVMIPLYLLLDPWHHGLVRVLPVVILLFVGFSAMAGASWEARLAEGALHARLHLEKGRETKD